VFKHNNRLPQIPDSRYLQDQLSGQFFEEVEIKLFSEEMVLIYLKDRIIENTFKRLAGLARFHLACQGSGDIGSLCNVRPDDSFFFESYIELEERLATFLEKYRGE